MRAEYKRDIIKELDMLLETGPVSKIYMDREELFLYKKAVYPEPDRYALETGKVVPFYMDELIEVYKVEFYYKDVLIGLEKDK